MNNLIKPIWTDIEHHLSRQLNDENIHHKTFAIAVSGGLDSMVVFDLMLKIRPQSNFIILHYHHGDSVNQETQNFRDQSFQLVQDQCLKYQKLDYNLSLHSAKSNLLLKSEDDFRKARLDFFRSILIDLEEKTSEKIVLITGHHRDDALETALLKMIRGCGSESLTRFKFWDQSILRPLINLGKDDLSSYAKHNNLSWIDDPSNLETHYLRNWIRQEWLPLLESKNPGAVKNLALSLEKVIADLKNDDELITIYKENVYSISSTHWKAWMSRPDYNALNRDQQIKALARLLSAANQREFTLGQLKEIQKRLDKNQKDLKFNIVRINWFINAQQIMVES